MYAIIEDSGTQIKVAEGDVIDVDSRELSDDAIELTFDRVLYVGGGEGEPKIGAPLVDGATVQGEVLEEGRGEKVEIIKFRRRKDYRRKRGHRQNYVRVRITSISA